MKHAILTVCGLAVVAMGCVTTGGASGGAIIRAKEKVAPALVHVKPVKEVFTQGRREEVVVVGSGFIISPDGYVVTNEHVAGESTIVRCVLGNKEEVDAHVVGTDKYTDIAVLKLDTVSKRLPTVKMGKSAKLEAGQIVLALGSPHGLSRSVSMGIVSVTDRYLGDSDDFRAPYNTWIQTDAAINPGNSGGPLVNLRGEVVGVNSRKLSGADNVGFAIPIDTAKEVVSEIIAHGRVIRSWLGLTLQEITRKTDDPLQRGVVIASVDPLSPAYAAQLRPGDVLLAINGQTADARYAEDLPVVRKQIADLPVGEEVTLRIARGDEVTDVVVRTVEKSELSGEEVALDEWGFTVSEVTPAMAQRARLTEYQGAFVSGTQAGGFADNAGLRMGDIILRVDGEKIPTLTRFRELYDARVQSKQRMVLMDVKRGALTRFVLLKQNGNGDDENKR